jgi:hypothetical protein
MVEMPKGRPSKRFSSYFSSNDCELITKLERSLLEKRIIKELSGEKLDDMKRWLARLIIGHPMI